MRNAIAFVLEVGCEEIPARFLEGAEHDLGERLLSALRAARLIPPDAPGDRPPMITASTPRRLIAYAPSLLRQQPSRVQEIIGPPVKVAFDKAGKPTRAAESFAAKNHAKVSDLRRVTNEKGEYLALDVSEPGRSTLQVLSEVLPSVIGGMTFPKNMYWTAKTGPLFVRPIRWILALLGNEDDIEVVPFEFAGVKSGNATYGHRLRGSEPLTVTNLNLDLLLKENNVIAHGPRRRERVREGIKALLEGDGARPVTDEWLETWVVNSTEWPAPLAGGFDPRYLALPREVLVTVMRDHQKYFAVEDSAGNLRSQFITVLNVPGDPKGLIRQGHERVLAARFADAEFFWNSDQKTTLAQRIPMLARVTYQAKLGTYADKIKRMKALAEKVCAELEQSGSMNTAEREHVLRAVELCKCDLTTQMVQEFTELQGVIGGLYAVSQGEPAKVAAAIYEHYRPVGIEDACPQYIAGAVVSLADKLDSIVAGFSVGLEPTGSSDPFGLRRAGNGIIRILFEFGIRLSLEDYSHQLDQNPWLRFCEFMSDREQYILQLVLGFPYDSVRAAVKASGGVGFLNPLNTKCRVEALEAIRGSADMQAICAAAKRTRNILHKSAELADYGASNSIEPDRLAQGPERGLYDAYLEIKDRLARHEAEGDYAGAFRALAALRPKVDDFFDKVLVMDPDEKIRANRLRLLSQLNATVFLQLADLAEIAPAAAANAGRG